MSATLDQIYDIETAIEAAFKTLFEEELFATYVTNDAASFQKERPRVELMFALGGETGHHSTASDYYRPDAFSGSLAVAIITPADDQGTAQHAQYRARVRNLMAKCRTRFRSDSEADDALLPYHTIMDVVESGTAPAYAPEDGHYISRINYELKTNIRPAAWPSE